MAERKQHSSNNHYDTHANDDSRPDLYLINNSLQAEDRSDLEKLVRSLRAKLTDQDLSIRNAVENEKNFRLKVE